MKTLKLLFLLLVCQISLFAQKSIDSEAQLLLALFLDIPVEAKVGEIITHIDTRDDFVQEDCFDEASCWLVEKHPLIRLSAYETIFVLAHHERKQEGNPKISMEIYLLEGNHKVLEKEYKRLKKIMKKGFHQIDKENRRSSLVVQEINSYRPKKRSIPASINLIWFKSNCKGTYSIILEYWKNN